MRFATPFSSRIAGIVRFVLVLWFMASIDCQAGWLLSSGLQLGTFSFRPENTEPTPNYVALGPKFAAGYSFAQAFDLAAFINYSPGYATELVVGQEHAKFVVFGFQAAIRLEEQVYFGVNVGHANYRRIIETDHSLAGYWHGPSASMSIGAIFEDKKDLFWHLTLDYLYGELTHIGTEGIPLTRKIDQLSLSVNYAFNGFKSSRLGFTLF